MQPSPAVGLEQARDARIVHSFQPWQDMFLFLVSFEDILTAEFWSRHVGREGFLIQLGLRGDDTRKMTGRMLILMIRRAIGGPIIDLRPSDFILGDAFAGGGGGKD